MKMDITHKKNYLKKSNGFVDAKKHLLVTLVFLLATVTNAFSQEIDFSDDAFFPAEDNQSSEFDFGSDEDFFGSADDDFFEGDGIDEMVGLEGEALSIAHGTLFEIGSVRVGGSFDLGLSTYTSLIRDDDMSFWDRVLDSRISPNANANLFVDARPTSVLRMYTKFGIRYPYKDSVGLSYSGSSGQLDDETIQKISDALNGVDISPLLNGGQTPTFSITNWLYLKELFTDFSVADRAFFRFGLHTVSWGAGLFFSPVSDMINSSSIDPENREAQVDGSLNLRAQITFPDSQNCLWLYLIPPSVADSSFPKIDDSQNQSLAEYLDSAMFPYLLKQTGLAGKMDVVISNWELGFGGVLRLENAPKLMFTASGSIINGKIGVFGEAVLSYGTQEQWKESTDWKNKNLIFQGTVGAMHMWTDPQITLIGQYYFDGNLDDHRYSTYGHNIAATAVFSNIAHTDLSATVFCLFYLGKENVSTINDAIEKLSSGKTFMPYAGIISASLSWTPFKNLSFSAGPYITWLDMTKTPDVAIKLGVTLGGGKF